MGFYVEPLLVTRKRSSLSSAPVKRKHFSWRWTPSILTSFPFLLILVTLCDIPYPVHPAPLPSSSAWSLPTLNYLFKDTKTRSQSLQYQKEQSGNSFFHNQRGVLPQYKTLPEGKNNENQNSKDNEGNMERSSSPSQSLSLASPPPASSSSSSSTSQLDKNKTEQKMSSTGRLISVHDIRLTDNWGWVRRGVSDPSQTTEQRRKQSRNNIRHSKSKSKHKQRHHVSSFYSSTTSSSAGKKKVDQNLLCPFDEIRGPDKKCRKAPRFSLYRVG